MIVMALFVIRRLLARGLQPLNDLADKTARVDVDSLSIRFSLDDLPTELRPIAFRLNDLFARLEHSFERERRFSADLAHELRTPLAELRSMLECALKWPDAREPHTDEEVLAICRHMERLVASILSMTRGEEGRIEVVSQALAVDQMVQRVWQKFAPAAAAKKILVDISALPATAVADESLLSSILTNLFDNAVEYTPAGGKITIFVIPSEAGTAVRVSNTVERFEAEDLPRLFDRFWRKETARTGDKHLGLGLTLARAFAGAMRWKLAASYGSDGRLTMTLHSQAAIADAR
jgi:two-component system sensor histidine kinase QseC